MRVLLVEDEWLIRTIMTEELVEAGFDVRSYETGDDAMSTLSDGEPGFDVLVTDIHMPGKTDGISLAQAVRRRFSEIPIIYTTGRPDALAREHPSGGRVLTLVKPYKPSRLIEAIRTMLDQGATVAG
jgi:DNA-binding response OmpR family regulator